MGGGEVEHSYWLLLAGPSILFRKHMEPRCQARYWVLMKLK